MERTASAAPTTTSVGGWSAPPAPWAAAYGPLVLRCLAAIVVGLQISYPLLHGVGRLRLAVLVVCVFALTCVAHAALTRGRGVALRMVAVTVGLGFVLEVLGVASGFPFGTYSYSAELGPRASGVPLVVALAWTMLAWPAAVAARRLAGRFHTRVLVGTWALAAADLFLDPQLVAVGAWHWRDPSPHLPGVDTVPLTNYAGWVLAALLVSAALQLVMGDGRDDLMVGLYLWLYAGWVVALALFLALPAAAAWGAAGMGLVAVPLARDAMRRRSLTPAAAFRMAASAAAARSRHSPRPATPRHTQAPAIPAGSPPN